jgi:sulfur carrier protein ThiS
MAISSESRYQEADRVFTTTHTYSERRQIDLNDAGEPLLTVRDTLYRTLVSSTADTDVPDEILAREGDSLQLLEWQKDVEHHQDFIKNLKNDFFENRVFVLTPKGDVIDLPEGSTTIDFAYAVHSDVGDHTASAKVNGKMVPLDTILQNKDIVEIETKENSSPKRKWIDMTKTTMAKRHIRAYIKEHGGALDKFLTR